LVLDPSLLVHLLDLVVDELPLLLLPHGELIEQNLLSVDELLVHLVLVHDLRLHRVVVVVLSPLELLLPGQMSFDLLQVEVFLNEGVGVLLPWFS
jgi:hypothetical protein